MVDHRDIAAEDQRLRKQAAVEEAIARVFYGSVRSLASAAITAIDAFENQQPCRARRSRSHIGEGGGSAWLMLAA